MTVEPRSISARPQVWAVGGGKGGTGKSLVAASLGIHLAQMGRRVVLVDGDLGAPNLHTILGLDPPPLALSDFVKRRFESIDSVVFDTGVPRLSIISGARNSLDIESLKHFQKTRLLRVLLGLPADVVLLDLGAGTSLNVLDLFCFADRGLLVALPEPTSVENSYRFLRAAFLRRLQHLGRTLGYRSIVDLVLQHRDQADAGRPTEILEEIGRIDACAAGALEAQVAIFRPHLVINQARAHEDVQLGESMEWVSERFVRVPLRFAGAIPYDPVLVQCLKTRRAYLSEYPRTRTAEMLRAVGESVLARARPVHAPSCGPWVEAAEARRTLGVGPHAPQDEIVRAFLRLRRALRPGSPALASLDCEAERRATIAEIDGAFRTLSPNRSDPSKALGQRSPARNARSFRGGPSPAA